nr:protein kinase [Anaerolineae bacterium]
MTEKPGWSGTGDLAGQKLGQYEIIEKLGQGGMATVYLARQTSIGRTVAIKVMPPHFMHDETFMQRFEREVQVIADLQHPRVLPVYDYGELDGRPYIVMAYMGGGTLVDLIRQGAMPVDEVVRIVEQIAEGLDHAHRKGVIHRDFKPSNVLMDDHGNAYLADFGIAKISEATVQLTGGGIVGTPAYMAPEMSQEGVTTKAIDIYALGVTIYEMLAGEFPFHGETPLSVMMAHATRPVPDVREKRPDIPVGVSAVIMRAMAKNPDDRYNTARELVAALKAAAQEQIDTEPEPFQPVHDAYTEPMDRPEPFPVPASTPPPATPTPAPTPYEQFTPAPSYQPALAPEKKKGCRWGLWLGIAGGAIFLAGLCFGLLVLVGAFGEIFGQPTPTPTTEAVIEATDTPEPQDETPESTATDTPPPDVSGDTATMVIINRSDYPVCEVYVSPNESDQWGDNQLGSNRVIGTGDSYTLRDIMPDRYDYMALDCDGYVLDEHYGVDLVAGGDYTWEIRDADTAITIVNSSSYTLCYVRISSPTDMVWGIDRLAEDEVIAPGDQAVVYMPSESYDMRTETCDGETWWEEYGIDITGGYTWTVLDATRLEN